MKSHTIPLLLAMTSQLVAFQFADLAEYTKNLPQAPRKRLKNETPPSFDANSQKVDVSGEHEFKAPGPKDARGPCPGLNAMANHGYLPRNGVATVQQFVDACVSVFNMGSDFALLLAIYGAVVSGDLKSWSIAGPMPEVPSPAPGLLGTPMGISYSHNKYESDGSITRCDMYTCRDPVPLQMKNFIDLYLRAHEFTLDVMNKFSSDRYNDTLNNNPYAFFGPVATAVRTAEYFFVAQMMSNHSAERPEGSLDRSTLKSFFAVSGTDGNFIYKPGHESIPKNWYKRPIDRPYDLVRVSLDLVASALKYPKFLSIGGNTGKPNSFVGVNLGDLTGGVFNAKNLLQGNNALCFAVQAMQAVVPDILKGSPFAEFLTAFNNVMGYSMWTLGCPQLAKFDFSLLSQFPGYTQLRANGTYY